MNSFRHALQQCAFLCIFTGFSLKSGTRQIHQAKIHVSHVCSIADTEVSAFMGLNISQKIHISGARQNLSSCCSAVGGMYECFQNVIYIKTSRIIPSSSPCYWSENQSSRCGSWREEMKPHCHVPDQGSIWSCSYWLMPQPEATDPSCIFNLCPNLEAMLGT